MFNRVSADGYFTSADGNLSWAVQDEELQRMGAAGKRRIMLREVPRGGLRN